MHGCKTIENRVGVGQPDAHRWRGNQDRLERALIQARGEGAQIVCSPELAVTGYGCEDLFLNPEVIDRAWRDWSVSETFAG